MVLVLPEAVTVGKGQHRPRILTKSKNESSNDEHNFFKCQLHIQLLLLLAIIRQWQECLVSQKCLLIILLKSWSHSKYGWQFVFKYIL